MSKQHQDDFTPYDTPPYAPKTIKPTPEDLASYAALDDTPPLYPSPIDEPDLARALAPVRRRGKRMPGTFKYAPDELWDMFRRFTRNFMPDRVLYRKELIKGGPMAGTFVDVEMQVPMTQEAFCLFCDMSPSTYINYRKKPEYETVTKMIDAAIFDNNYTMGAVGLIHAGLVARKHGMAEHSDIQSGGKTIDIIPIQFSFPKKSLEGTLNKALDTFDELG